MEITRELFEEQKRPRFGTANPERMRLAFWEWMIRGDGSGSPPDDGPTFVDDSGYTRVARAASAYAPWQAREHFGIASTCEDGPIWTFERMGATQTELPDGRIVCVGGEHEDYYDPDFCIYNDVIVFDADGAIEIHGYPKEVFPPTDFHTATLVGDRLILIGRLGYMNERRPGQTPVYALDLSGYRIAPIETSGAMPGWIFEHEAELDPRGVVTVRGGKLLVAPGGEQRIKRNVEEYALDLRSGVWRQMTDRNWPQFVIRPEGRRYFDPDATAQRLSLYPRETEHTILPCDDLLGIRFEVRGIPVSVAVGIDEIEILIQGALPAGLAERIAEEVRVAAEAATRSRCIAEPA
jgi:hypothetical protein